MNNIFARLFYELEKHRDSMLVTVVDSEGSGPRSNGAMMLVGEKGYLTGTIGGGAIEKQSVERAVSMIKDSMSGTHEYKLNKGDTDDLGMVCGGNMTVHFQFIDGGDKDWYALASNIVNQTSTHLGGWLVLHMNGDFPGLLDSKRNLLMGSFDGADECLPNAPVNHNGNEFSIPIPTGERAFIFGAGHCAHALAPILASVGFLVTVMDYRKEFVTEERYPEAHSLVCGDFKKISEYVTPGPDDYAVVMTNGHSFDFEVEEQLLGLDLAYVGVIGSKAKTAVVNEKLRAAGVPEEKISGVYTPIGLKIGAVTPEEIAVSIAAEMIQVRAGRRKIG